MDKSLVFVSHATADKQYAELLGRYIERTFENTRVFVASAPEAIPSGSVWFEEILRNLSCADALVIVYSRNAQSRLWVGFELGYIWKKYDGKKIHCVYDPQVVLPSPLSVLQAKDLKDPYAMIVFFEGLSDDLGRNFDADEIGITELVNKAPKHDEFAKWRSLLKNGQWSEQVISDEHGNKTVWTSVDDPTFQIEDPHLIAAEKFSQPWSEGFPDPQTSSYHVNLNISGATVMQEKFVSLDGHRYFVPLPERKSHHGADNAVELPTVFYYDASSIRYLVGKMICESDSYRMDLDEFAARQGISII